MGSSGRALRREQGFRRSSFICSMGSSSASPSQCNACKMEWGEIYGRLLADRNDGEAWDALWSRVLGWARRALWQRGWYAIEDAVEETCAGVVLNLDKAQG